MIREKYAIRFPGLQSIDIDSTLPNNIFSEPAIEKAKNTFYRTFDALGNLAGYVIQKNKTQELSEQLKAQKSAFDVSIDNVEKQERIKLEEYSKRLQARLEDEKANMEIEMKKLVLETSEKIADFSTSFEEVIAENKLFLNIIRQEKKFLGDIQGYIEQLTDVYSNRKEYVIYCDLQRKSLELVDAYLKKMI